MTDGELFAMPKLTRNALEQELARRREAGAAPQPSGKSPRLRVISGQGEGVSTRTRTEAAKPASELTKRVMEVMSSLQRTELPSLKRNFLQSAQKELGKHLPSYQDYQSLPTGDRQALSPPTRRAGLIAGALDKLLVVAQGHPHQLAALVARSDAALPMAELTAQVRQQMSAIRQVIAVTQDTEFWKLAADRTMTGWHAAGPLPVLSNNDWEMLQADLLAERVSQFRNMERPAEAGSFRANAAPIDWLLTRWPGVGSAWLLPLTALAAGLIYAAM